LAPEDFYPNPVVNKKHASAKRGDILTLDIDSLAFGGSGVARHEDLVVFVEDALPRQTVEAIVLKKKKNFAEARLVRVLKPSPFQQTPRCAHFEQCGGCTLQHLLYAKQVEEKARQVAESLQHIGGFTDLILEEPLAAPETFFYRNKMEFSFAAFRYLPREELKQGEPLSAGVHLGLHAKGFYNKVIDIGQCLLLTPISNDILQAVREFAVNSGKPVYDTQTHSGFWRFLVIRHAKTTDELLVNLVAYEYDDALAQQFKNEMMEKFPAITTLMFSTTQNRAGVAFSEKEHLLHGQPYIRENIGPIGFNISANSFFQTNSLQAKRLYDVIAEWAAIQPHEIVYDLYCGAGTISLYVSRSAARVVGFESVAAAVSDAHRNAHDNGIDNCDFVLGDLRDQLTDTAAIVAAHGKPDVMIIDPPRAGMHPKTVEAILRLQPQRIVHVSCNPASLARDLQLLCADGYRLLRVKPVDMFPHTTHIEVVAELTRC
jgi:23S rRNA (uracil1939-C5)-methyltransferase